MTGFQKDSLGWQLQLIQMRVREWFEQLFQSPGDRRRGALSFPDFALSPEVARVFFWVMVLALAGWLSWQLYRLLSPYLGREGLFWRGAKRTAAAAGQGEQLTVAEWLARSRTYAQQGNYTEACRALYMAALRRLADQEILPEEPSRTDGEYLNALQVLPKVEPYQVLFRTHERLCFSQTEITKGNFHLCDQAYRETETP